MKNKLLIAIIFCILICFAGCSMNNSDGEVSDLHSDNIVNDSQASLPDSQTHSENSDYPNSDGETSDNESEFKSQEEAPVGDEIQILSFDSLEQISELSSITIKDEETVAEYLDQKGFSMNGLSTKNDVVGLFEKIGDLDMLHLDSLSGYKLANISYYVTYDYIMSTYTNGNNIVRFIYYIDPADELNSSKNSNDETELVGTFNIGTTSVGLHSVNEANSPYAFFASYETKNSLITILFSESDKTKIENAISPKIVLSSLTDLING